MIANAQTAVVAFLAGGAGAAAIVFGAIRAFGGKWLDSKFAEKIEVLRHQQIAELERWKAETAREHDRATRLAQREFEIVPETWAKLTAAYNSVRGMSAFFKQHADVSRMTHEELQSFLEEVDLPKSHKKEIATASAGERNRIFGKAISFAEARQSKEAWWDASEALNGNAIFLDEEAITKMRELLDELWKVIADFTFSREESALPARDGPLNMFRRSGEDRYRELERFMRARYFPLAESS